MDTAASALAQLFDTSFIENEMNAKKEQFLNEMQINIKNAILAMPPSDALSFNKMSGELVVGKVQCEASTTYVGALIAYMREKPYDGYVLDSYVTPVVMQAVENTVVNFYTSEDLQQILIQEIFDQMKGSGALGKVIRGEISANKDWLQHELKTLLAKEGASSIADEVLETMTTQIISFMSSSMGKTVLLTIGKILATTAGKTLLTKITIIVGKILAASVLKPLLILLVKKIGIAVLIKAAIGKVIIGLLAALGITGIPIVWIIAPIIFGFLLYEYHNFPQKLAEKIPIEVIAGLRDQFETLNKSIINSLVTTVFENLLNQLAKMPSE